MKKQLLIISVALLLVVGAVKATDMTMKASDIKVTMSISELLEAMGQQETENMGGMSSQARDIFGVKGTATSTTPLGFYGANVASTTYPVFVGQDTDLAIISLYTDVASSTANWQLSILGSNDSACDTATTSPDVGNPVLVADINWFDIADHLTNKVHPTSLGIGTTTIPYLNPAGGTGRTLILENLNYKCIALNVSASSTTGWAQIQTKEYR